MTSYSVKIYPQLVCSSAGFSWSDYGIACVLNNSLREQGAPHVESAFIEPSTWRKEILKIYTSITQNTSFDGSLVFTFRLGETTRDD